MKTGQRSFWDEYAPHYEAFLRHVRKPYDRLVRFIVSYCSADLDVLEIGTGTGVMALRLAGRVRHTDAIDPSREMIKEAEALRTEAGAENVDFWVRDGYDTGFPDGRYDMVIVSNVLHVIEDPAQLLAEVGRVVRPNGIVMIATYCHGTSVLTRLVSFLMSLRGFKALQKWSPVGLENFVRGRGFEVRDRIVIRGVIPLVAMAGTPPQRGPG